MESPRAPIWLLGSREAVVGRYQAWKAQALKSDGRSWPCTAPVLAAAVVSLYRSYSEDAWCRYRDDAIKFFRERYGLRIAGVCEHEDESQHHVHIYLVPEAGESFGAVYPGYDEIRKRQDAAKRIAKLFPHKEERQAEYDRAQLGRMASFAKSAFVRFQDAFFEGVARHHGLARTGPRRDRLERGIYLRTTGAEKALAEAEAKRAEAARLLAEATAARRAAEDARTAAQAELARASEQAQRATERLIDEAKVANRELARLLSEFAELPDVKKLQAVEAVTARTAAVARAAQEAGLERLTKPAEPDYRLHPGYIDSRAPVRPSPPGPFDASTIAKKRKSDGR